MAGTDLDIPALYAAAIDLHRQGRLAEAGQAYREILRAAPAHAGAVMHLGLIAHRSGRSDEAVGEIRAALAIDPHFEPAHYNLGAVLLDQGRFADVVAAFDAAAAAGVGSERLQVNRAVALTRLGQPDRALAAYDEGLALYPDSAELHVHKALIHLAAGRFEAAWLDYEWRWRLAGYAPSRVPQPRWRGEDPAGRAIMLFQEQGVGDTLLFARFAPPVARLAPTTLAVRPPLVRLMSSLPGGIRVVSMSGPLPPFDLQCPLPSLPLAFATTLETLPRETPYLGAEPERVAHWRERLPEGAFRVGIAWQGNAAYQSDALRSARLAEFAPLARLPGVRLISLQKHDGVDQLAGLPAGMEVTTLEGLDDGPDAFVDTAAVMMNLDLVVSVDSAVAHLGGALGRPTWVALGEDPYWVWTREGDRSPWHPTARLFRRQPGEAWSGVFDRMASALAPLVAARSGDAAPRAPRAPRAPVSWGELIDKITILEIKAARFERLEAVANVERERAALMAELQTLGALSPRVEALKQSLRETNEALFDIEDAIREKERLQAFDDAFIQLARSVYIQNDRRGRLKAEVNAALGSELVEEKQYARYEATPEGKAR
jgi:tetratricopeptide (TPR) repeat protein